MKYKQNVLSEPTKHFYGLLICLMLLTHIANTLRRKLFTASNHCTRRDTAFYKYVHYQPSSLKMVFHLEMTFEMGCFGLKIKHESVILK